MADGLSQFDACLEVHPPLARTEEVLKSVPARRGLLLLLGRDDQPLILLAAADLRGRLRGRLEAPADGQAEKSKRRVDWRQITRKVFWKLTDSHFGTDLAYLEAARQIWPEGFCKMLSWRPAWFVHVDPSGRTPYFAKVARLLPPPGLCLGPFSSGRSAQGFMDIIQDAFDLCREPRRLAQAPHGRPCAYQQMGRCVGVCDGSMAMDVYRTVVAQAAAYAAGQRAGYLQELTERMKRAADQLRFEQAGAIKARLDRLRQLDGPAYAHVAEGEAFQFVLVQRGGGRKAAEVFLTDRGLIVSAPPLRWPLEDQQLQQTLDRVAGLVQDGSAAGRYDSWRVGLVASYLFSGPQRRGAILRWRRGMTGRELGQAVEQSAANLALGQEVEKDRARAGGTSSSTDAATPL